MSRSPGPRLQREVWPVGPSPSRPGSAGGRDLRRPDRVLPGRDAGMGRAGAASGWAAVSRRWARAVNSTRPRRIRSDGPTCFAPRPVASEREGEGSVRAPRTGPVIGDSVRGASPTARLRERGKDGSALRFPLPSLTLQRRRGLCAGGGVNRVAAKKGDAWPRLCACASGAGPRAGGSRPMRSPRATIRPCSTPSPRYSAATPPTSPIASPAAWASAAPAP